MKTNQWSIIELHYNIVLIINHINIHEMEKTKGEERERKRKNIQEI